jgi:small subunit ribosomal protein S10
MKCYIKIKSFNHIILENISKNFLNESKIYNIKQASSIGLPKRLKKFSLIKSPHVHKKSREQFESLTHNKILYVEGSKLNVEKIIKNSIYNNKHTFSFKIKWLY